MRLFDKALLLLVYICFILNISLIIPCFRFVIGGAIIAVNLIKTLLVVESDSVCLTGKELYVCILVVFGFIYVLCIYKYLCLLAGFARELINENNELCCSVNFLGRIKIISVIVANVFFAGVLAFLARFL